MAQLCRFIMIGLLVLSSGWATIANATEGPRTRIERTITREFKTFDEPFVRLNTQKGQIKFRTWNENRILIQITIVSEADSKSRAENGLDMVHVITRKSGETMHIETDFNDQDDNNSFWSLIQFWEDNLKLTVDMVVNVPVNTQYDLTHRYGDLILPNIRSAKVNIKYGSFHSGFVRENLDLSAAYSKGSIGDLNHGTVLLQYSDFMFGNLVNGDIVAEYSKFRTTDSEELKVTSKYSSMIIGAVNTINLDGKFDKIEIEETNNVKINTKYTAIEIGRVRSNIEITNSFQSTRIRYILPGFQDVQVVGKYGNCVLGFEGSPDADFELETKYGNIKMPGDAKVLSKDATNSQKLLKGRLGEGGGNIYVVNSYGNITLEYH